MHVCMYVCMYVCMSTRNKRTAHERDVGNLAECIQVTCFILSRRREREREAYKRQRNPGTAFRLPLSLSLYTHLSYPQVFQMRSSHLPNIGAFNLPGPPSGCRKKLIGSLPPQPLPHQRAHPIPIAAPAQQTCGIFFCHPSTADAGHPPRPQLPAQHAPTQPIAVGVLHRAKKVLNYHSVDFMRHQSFAFYNKGCREWDACARAWRRVGASGAGARGCKSSCLIWLHFLRFSFAVATSAMLPASLKAFKVQLLSSCVRLLTCLQL